MDHRFSAEDYRFMARALQLARKGLYTTHPNPRVGSVLVKDGQVIGEGFHRKAGELHAERNAIANASESTVGATAYVTLEPCCHYGKTPPCTEGLIEAGISRVVIGMQDPNPMVAGKGIETLEAAGITVASGLLEEQAKRLNPGFIKRMQQDLPYVRCKMAASLDARTAMASGESTWISSDQSRRDVQFLRAESSAIVTGVGTVLADDPSLNVRLSANELLLDKDLSVLQPVRVILDADLQTPVDAKILNLPGEVILFCSQAAANEAVKYTMDNVSVVAVDSDQGLLDLQQVLKELAQRQINDVLLETGSTLAGSMLSQGLIDEIVVYQAPHFMGDFARGLFHLPAIDKMSQRIQLSVLDSRRIGEDTRMTLKVGSD